MLRTEFHMPEVRAGSSVKLGSRLLDGQVKNHPLGYLAGVRLSATDARRVLSICPGPTNNDGARATRISYSQVAKAWARNEAGKVVRLAASSNDLPSMGVAAALLASMTEADGVEGFRPLYEAQTLSLARPTPATICERRADRVLLAAYALSSLRRSSIDLIDGAWSDGTRSWRFRAAPWLLPILDPEDNTAVRQLLTAALARGLDFVPLPATSSPHTNEAEVLARTTARAQVQASQLTKAAHRPMWFDGGSGRAQVLLTEDDDHAYAWVGRDGIGLLVAFDTDQFVGYGLDEQGTPAALSMAIGWFIDVSKSLRASPSGTANLSRTGSGSTAKGYRHVPTESFTKHSSNVAKNVQMTPLPHVVAAHLRRYAPGGRIPRDEARDRAPIRLRRIMTESDTYVRSHHRIDAAVAELDIHLSKHSALSDVLGQLR
jgi:hypothetical protein